MDVKLFCVFIDNVGWCRLVNIRCERGEWYLCLVCVLLMGMLVAIMFLACIGPEINDDGNSRWDSEGSWKGPCFYGRPSWRRASGCCGKVFGIKKINKIIVQLLCYSLDCFHKCNWYNLWFYVAFVNKRSIYWLPDICFLSFSTYNNILLLLLPSFFFYPFNVVARSRS